MVQNLGKLILCELSGVPGLLAPIPYVFAGALSATVHHNFPTAQKTLYVLERSRFEIYKNDNGLGGNQCSCEKRLLFS